MARCLIVLLFAWVHILEPTVEAAAYLGHKYRRFSKASRSVDEELPFGRIPLSEGTVRRCLKDTKSRSSDDLHNTAITAVEAVASAQASSNRGLWSTALEQALGQINADLRGHLAALFEPIHNESQQSKEQLECVALWNFDAAAAWHDLASEVANFGDGPPQGQNRNNEPVIPQRTREQISELRYKEECNGRAQLLRPGNAVYLMDLCASRIAQPHHPKVDSCFEQLLALECDSVQSCKDHAEMMENMRQDEPAIQSLYRGVDLAETQSDTNVVDDVIRSLNQILIKSGRFEELGKFRGKFVQQGANHKRWRDWKQTCSDQDVTVSTLPFTNQQPCNELPSKSNEPGTSYPSTQLQKLARMREALGQYFRAHPEMCDTVNVGSSRGSSIMGVQSILLMNSDPKTAERPGWAALRRPAQISDLLSVDSAGRDPTPFGNAWGPNGTGWSEEDWPYYLMSHTPAVCAQMKTRTSAYQRRTAANPQVPKALATTRYSCDGILAAAWLMDADRVRSLLRDGQEHRSSVAECTDSFNATVLHYAVEQADLLTFEVVLNEESRRIQQLFPVSPHGSSDDMDEQRNHECAKILDKEDLHGNTVRRLMCCKPGEGGSMASEAMFPWVHNQMQHVIDATICSVNSMCCNVLCRGTTPAPRTTEGRPEYPKGWATQNLTRPALSNGFAPWGWNAATKPFARATRGKIPVVDARSTSMAEVVTRYLSAGLPVTVSNAFAACASIDSTSIYRLFDKDALKSSQLGRLNIESVVGLGKEDIRITEFVDQFMGRTAVYNESKTDNPEYNHLRYIAFHMEGAQQKSPHEPLGSTLEPLSSLLECSPLAIQEYFKLRPSSMPGSWSDFAVTLGGAGSGSQFHWHESALNWQIFGRKRWFVFHPAISSFNLEPTLEWLDKSYATLPSELKPFEFIQEPGDLVLLPQFFGHATVCLEDCMSMFHVNSVEYNSQLSGPFRDSAYSGADHAKWEAQRIQQREIEEEDSFMFDPIAPVV